MQNLNVGNFLIIIFSNYSSIDSVLLHLGGMPSMIGLPSDRALADDDECLRFCLSKTSCDPHYFAEHSRAIVGYVLVPQIVINMVRWHEI